MDIKGLDCGGCAHAIVCKNRVPNMEFSEKLGKMQDRDGSIYTNVDLDLVVEIYCPNFVEKQIVNRIYPISEERLG